MYFFTMCFICLKSKIDLNVINKEILNKLLYFIDKEEDLTLPISHRRKMCNDCSNKLNAAFHFKEMCLKNILQFEDYIRELEQEFNNFNLYKTMTVDLTDINKSKSTLEVNELEQYSNEELGTPIIRKEILNELNFENYGTNKNGKTYLNEEVKRLSPNEEIVAEELKNESIKKSDMDLNDRNFSKILNKHHSNERTEKVLAKSERLDNLRSQSYGDIDSEKQYGNEDLELKLHKEEFIDDFNEEVELRSEKILKYDYFQEQESNELMSTEGSRKSQLVFICATCGARFTLKKDIEEHVQIHSDKKPESNFCDKCQKSFANKFSLRKHMFIHSKEKPYSCALCMKGFNQKVNLVAHMSIHSKKRPHSCSICRKTFGRKGYLNQHMLSHSKEKPHSCSVCMKRFTIKYNLKKHMVIHSQERPYSCPVCMKSFRLKSYLNYHMLNHTEERPFCCSICMKGFKNKSHLNQHKLIHSKEKSHYCSVCMKSFCLKSNLMVHLNSSTHALKYALKQALTQALKQ